jgi:hypothetical protein
MSTMRWLPLVTVLALASVALPISAASEPKPSAVTGGAWLHA